MKITKIEGIGPVYAAMLEDKGIHTTEALLQKAASSQGRKDLAEQTGISDRLILDWVNRADLMRVKGIGEEYSDLLEAAGVDTVKELRNRNPDNLHKALVDANEVKHLVRRVPALSEVHRWVEYAATLAPVLTY